jgi:putative polyhydroxyalkanoate system protein
MSDIHIRRDHSLGLTRARKVAWKWAEHAEQKLDMECTVLEGDTSDTVQFVRSGVTGTLIVTGDHFDMDVKLGFLFKAFAGQIEAEACKQLDSALAKEASKGPGKKA